MGFRGINPDGLHNLSGLLRQTTERAAVLSRPGIEILSRHAFADRAAALAGTVVRTSLWGNETAANLTGRAGLIRSGQNNSYNPRALLQARYATEADLSFATFEAWHGSRQRVEHAVGSISRWLDQRWNDWDVTNNDLQSIAAALGGLNGPELNQVVASLSPSQLVRWIEEMGSKINGLSRDERRAVFEVLAINAFGDELARVHDATLLGGSVEDLLDLGLAIRVHSPDPAIVDFVTSTMTRDLSSHEYSTVAPALAVAGIENARAIERATRAIAATDAAIELVITDSLMSARAEDTGAACSTVDPLASVVQAFQRGADVESAATVFAVIADGLANPSRLHQILNDRHSLDRTPEVQLPGFTPAQDRVAAVLAAGSHELLNAATTLLVSGADELMPLLATEIDPSGEIMTGYLHRLIDAERIDDLGRIVDATRGGAVVDPIRFAARGHQPGYPYPHAQNLGYLAGTLTNALGEIATEAKLEITGIGAIASLLSGIVAPLVDLPIIAGMTATAGEMGGEWLFFDGAQRKIDRSLTALLRNVEEALQPAATNTISVAGGDLAWQTWLSRFRHIVPTG